MSYLRYILAKKKKVTFYPFSETFSETEFRRNELVYMAEESDSIKAVSQLLLIALTQIFPGREQVQQKI